jgi:hypothetical protein
MPNITTFNTSAPYIYLSIFVFTESGSFHEFDAIFDTGAPRTEFSDTALKYAGFIDETKPVTLKTGIQTQKYGNSWGIDALIGLDFLRQFKVEIDYSKGVLTSDKLPIPVR